MNSFLPWFESVLRHDKKGKFVGVIVEVVCFILAQKKVEKRDNSIIEVKTRLII